MSLPGSMEAAKQLAKKLDGSKIGIARGKINQTFMDRVLDRIKELQSNNTDSSKLSEDVINHMLSLLPTFVDQAFSLELGLVYNRQILWKALFEQTSELLAEINPELFEDKLVNVNSSNWKETFFRAYIDNRWILLLSEYNLVCKRCYSVIPVRSVFRRLCRAGGVSRLHLACPMSKTELVEFISTGAISK